MKYNINNERFRNGYLKDEKSPATIATGLLNYKLRI